MHDLAWAIERRFPHRPRLPAGRVLAIAVAGGLAAGVVIARFFDRRRTCSE